MPPRDRIGGGSGQVGKDDIRALGGALFCDRRYGKVFVYHNGAQSSERGIGAARAALGQTLLSFTSSLWENCFLTERFLECLLGARPA